MGRKEQRRVLQTLFAQATGSVSIFYILAFIVSTTWLTSVIYDAFKGWNTIYTYWILGLVSFSMLSYLFMVSKKLQNEFAEDDHVDINSIVTEPKKILVLFLSNLNTALPSAMNKSETETWLGKDKNPWQMPYKSIETHKSTLEKVYVLTSSESSPQFDAFSNMVKRNTSRKFNFEEIEIEDLHDIEQYNAAFHQIYLQASHHTDRQLVIDVTSGVKLYSIAGSYFALSSNKVIQYLDFNYKVHQFDNKVLKE